MVSFFGQIEKKVNNVIKTAKTAVSNPVSIKPVSKSFITKMTSDPVYIGIGIVVLLVIGIILFKMLSKKGKKKKKGKYFGNDFKWSDNETSIGTSFLNPGESITNNRSLLSKNKKYHLVMQDDGNLVIYEGTRETGTPVWSSDTTSNLVAKYYFGPSKDGKKVYILKDEGDKGDIVKTLYEAPENRAIKYIQISRDGKLNIVGTQLQPDGSPDILRSFP